MRIRDEGEGLQTSQVTKASNRTKVKARYRPNRMIDQWISESINQ
jgi:hypothetical protein